MEKKTPLIGACADQIEIITPNDGKHYFFGYYDLPATDLEDRHLCHRVPFMDRLPTAEDVAELGYVQDGVFTLIDTTTAWNFQQGALLQFHPTKPNTVCYNAYRDGRFCTVTREIGSDTAQYTDMPAAAISADGKWGLSVNFGRIYDFRPGYGYAGCRDKWAEVDVPAEDGIFLTDMEKGNSSLLLSYTQMAAVADMGEGRKLLVNHINFSPDFNHYVMLFRNFCAPGERMWRTSLLVGDLKGNLRALLVNGMASHYRWINERELIIFCAVAGKRGLYCFDTETGESREYELSIWQETGAADIHCNLLPNGKYVIGDGYPREGYRHLLAYNRETGESRDLFGALAVIPPVIDIRCDLHVRFSADGRWLTFDTTQNRCRQIARLPSDVLNF